MLVTTVADKSFAVFTNLGKLDQELSAEVNEVIAEHHAGELGKRLREAVVSREYPTANNAQKELMKLADLLREEVKNYNVFRLTDKRLQKMAQKIQGKRITLKPKQVNKEHPLFTVFADTLPEKAKTVLLRGINGHTMLSVEIEADNESMPAILMVDLGDHVWVPSFPSNLEFDNGDKLSTYEAEDLFKSVMDQAIPNHKDRGVVNVKGPRGGDQLVGEVFSKKRRDEIANKTITLENGYTLELFA